MADSASTIVINGKVVSPGSSRVDGINVYVGDDHPTVAAMVAARKVCQPTCVVFASVVTRHACS